MALNEAEQKVKKGTLIVMAILCAIFLIWLATKEHGSGEIYQGTVDGAVITEKDLGGGYKMICATRGSERICNKVFVNN